VGENPRKENGEKHNPARVEPFLGSWITGAFSLLFTPDVIQIQALLA